jgi:hypothetical protein
VETRAREWREVHGYREEIVSVWDGPPGDCPSDKSGEQTEKKRGPENPSTSGSGDREQGLMREEGSSACPLKNVLDKKTMSSLEKIQLLQKQTGTSNESEEHGWNVIMALAKARADGDPSEFLKIVFFPLQPPHRSQLLELMLLGSSITKARILMFFRHSNGYSISVPY